MSRRSARFLFPILGLATALASRPAPAQGHGALERVVKEAVAGHDGIVGVGVRNLDTGESASIRGGEVFPTASLIKLSLLVGLLDEVRAGRLGLDEPLTMLARDRVGGSGVLRHMAPGLRITVEDAAWLMMVLSDNTATNLLVGVVGPVPVWEKMDALGLPRTRVYRKSFHDAATSPQPDSSARYGLGATTPDETVRLLALLHEGRAVSPALDSLALAMLRANQDGTKLVRWIPEDTPAAHKSGWDDRGWNDCGILYTPAAPVAVCVMMRENAEESYAVDAAASRVIARVGRAVYAHFNPGVALPALPPG